MTDDDTVYGAQVVLKRADGTSILDAQEALTASVIDKYRVPQEVRDTARKALEGLGFRVTGGDGTTISIEGSRTKFVETFGIEAGAEAVGVAAHATRIPDKVSDYVADVIVPPAPSFF
ncbi:hypothetical protein [Labrenzia sp. DG1229]|uniref:hypothetical protein n=1 Tax=Labrenzia sp. DG1229 TaxID=681847 RepID=UPI0006899962|nr:hypothetical protein [Labrenzia sp. DG1229]